MLIITYVFTLLGSIHTYASMLCVCVCVCVCVCACVCVCVCSHVVAVLRSQAPVLAGFCFTLWGSYMPGRIITEMSGMHCSVPTIE